MTCHAGIIDLLVCLVFLVDIVCTTCYGSKRSATLGGLTIVANYGAKHGTTRSTHGCSAQDTV